MTTQPSTDLTFCYSCGKALTGTKQFCSACGADQKDTFLAQAAQALPPEEPPTEPIPFLDHVFIFLKGLLGLIVIIALILLGFLLVHFFSVRGGMEGEMLLLPYLTYLGLVLFLALGEIVVSAQKGFDPDRGQLSKIVVLICTFVPPAAIRANLLFW